MADFAALFTNFEKKSIKKFFPSSPHISSTTIAHPFFCDATLVVPAIILHFADCCLNSYFVCFVVARLNWEIMNNQNILDVRFTKVM